MTGDDMNPKVLNVGAMNLNQSRFAVTFLYARFAYQPNEDTTEENNLGNSITRSTESGCTAKLP